MPDDALAVITPSTWRRGFAVGMLGLLGAVLVYIALNTAEAGYALRGLFLGAGVGGVILAERVWRATAVSIVLTEAGIHDTRGRQLCAASDIVHIERGAFAFKPSNGFAIKLAHRADRAWVPGMWWRFGRRLGVGGVVSKHEAKAMADMIALRLKPPPGF